VYFKGNRMLDLSTAYHRYRFLGDEFLTWLWFTIEKDPNLFTSVDADCAALEIGNRIVLENRKTKSVERITIKGDDAGLEEGRLALRKGALVSEMAMVFKTGEYQWQFSIKGESLNVNSLRTPGPTVPQGSEQIEPFLLERYEFINKIVVFIENTYKSFIRVRLSPQWLSKQVPSIRKWINAADV
jgi:hypothetical protein